MHAVVDTNVLVSSLLQPAGPPGAVLAGITAGRLVPVVCEATMDEYRRVLARPRLQIPPAAAAELLHLLRLTAHWVPAPPYTGTPTLPDPADWPFIACALVAGCPVITGNMRHFPELTGLKVMTARGWVDGSTQP